MTYRLALPVAFQASAIECPVSGAGREGRPDAREDMAKKSITMREVGRATQRHLTNRGELLSNEGQSGVRMRRKEPNGGIPRGFCNPITLPQEAQTEKLTGHKYVL